MMSVGFEIMNDGLDCNSSSISHVPHVQATLSIPAALDDLISIALSPNDITSCFANFNNSNALIIGSGWGFFWVVVK